VRGFWLLALAGKGAGPYAEIMGDAINLADPDFEPTDEQLIGLSKRAFAGVAAKYEAAFARLRAEIEVMQTQGLKDLAQRQADSAKAK
jgi:hypothetical protein